MLAALACATLFAAASAERVTVRGAIEIADHDGANEGWPAIYLVADSGERLELISDEPDTLHTWSDPELKDRTWELEGFRLDGDRFEVRKMFTIKDGKRYQVTYYCEICHITSYRPGPCMCCQEKVELREIAVDE